MATDRQTATPLGELIGLFLRLGFTAFGGPAAHIALMKEEVVTRRRWLTEPEFLDLLGATNLIPGPNSTEMAIHIGFLRGRWAGLVCAGLCFIVPAALLVSACAWAYRQYGSLPAVGGVLYAVKPVVVAVVIQAIWGLVRPAVKSVPLGIIGVIVLVLALFAISPLYLLFGAGLLTGVSRWWQKDEPTAKRSPRSLLVLLLSVAAMVSLPSLLIWLLPTTQGRVPYGPGPLFLFFLKVGSVLYGSGYVLLAFLRDELVTHWRWLTEAQLLDAVAIGQVTPGPVFTTATFIGYVLGGPTGALLATIGIFLPSFVFVGISGLLVPKLRSSPIMAAFLDGANVAALALMAATIFDICRTALIDLLTVAIAILSAFLLLRFKINSAYLLLGAAIVGLLHALVR